MAKTSINIDKKKGVCLYKSMELKIYRNGQYDRKANLALKAKNLMRDKAARIDNFFVNH